MRIRRHIEENANSDSTSLKDFNTTSSQHGDMQKLGERVATVPSFDKSQEWTIPALRFAMLHHREQIFFRLRNRRQFPLPFGT